MYARLVILLIPVLLSGCTRDLTFRVVDAATGEPVPGVNTFVDASNWQPGAPGLFPVNFRVPSLSSITVTDSQGLAEQTDVASNQNIFFEKEGYCRAVIGRRWPTARIQHYGQDSSVRGKEVDGAIVVPLRREESKSTLFYSLPNDVSTTNEWPEIQ